MRIDDVIQMWEEHLRRGHIVDYSGNETRGLITATIDILKKHDKLINRLEEMLKKTMG